LQCKIRGLDEKHHFAILRTERAEIWKNPNHFLPVRLNLLLKILTVESNGAKPAKSGYGNS